MSEEDKMACTRWYELGRKEAIAEFLPIIKRVIYQIEALISFAKKSRCGKLHNSLEDLIDHEDSGTIALYLVMKAELKKWVKMNNVG